MQCYLCGAPAETDHRFCAQCGLPLPGTPPKDAGKRQAILQGDVDINALTRLRERKQRLSDDLYEIVEITKSGRELSEHERRICKELYTEWKHVSQEVSARVDYFCQRIEQDRREGPIRTTEHRKQHMGLDIDERRDGSDRRAAERRNATDRRDPFKHLVPDM